MVDVLGQQMGLTPLNWREKVKQKRENLKNEIVTQNKEITKAERHIETKNENKQGIFTWKEALRRAINEARGVCETREKFKEYLKEEFGVEMPRNTENTISFIHPAVNKRIRGSRLGADYTAEEIDIDLNNNLQRRINNELRLTEQNEIKNGHIHKSGEQQENYQGTRRTESTGERTTNKAIRATPTSTSTPRTASTPRTTRPNEATINQGNKPRTVSKLGVEGNIDEIKRNLQRIDGKFQQTISNNQKPSDQEYSAVDGRSEQNPRQQQNIRRSSKSKSIGISR